MAQYQTLFMDMHNSLLTTLCFKLDWIFYCFTSLKIWLVRDSTKDSAQNSEWIKVQQQQKMSNLGKL